MDQLERYISARDAEVPAGDTRLLREVAYDRLKDAIRHANLPPGEPLSENRLSRMLGISRTPVREALQMLSQEGLVEIIPGRAVRIANRSFRAVVDVLYIRLLLEPGLVRLVTENIAAEQMELLWDCLLKMEAAVVAEDREAWARADATWHEAMSAACPNELLGDMTLQMHNRIHRYASIDHELKMEQLRNGTAEHRRIMEEMSAGNADGAEQAMRDHLEHLRKNLFDQLIYR